VFDLQHFRALEAEDGRGLHYKAAVFIEIEEVFGLYDFAVEDRDGAEAQSQGGIDSRHFVFKVDEFVVDCQRDLLFPSEVDFYFELVDYFAVLLCEEESECVRVSGAEYHIVGNMRARVEFVYVFDLQYEEGGVVVAEADGFDVADGQET
jgi:hypothetical protein